MDFKDYPVSITEAKADAATENAGSVWTPRDALIAALREIDNGEVEISTLIVCYKDEKSNRVRFKQASPSMYTTLGVMEAIKASMLE